MRAARTGSAGLLALLLAGACARSPEAPATAPGSSGSPASARPESAPAASDPLPDPAGLPLAVEALDGGRLEEAEERLQEIIARESAAASRGKALYLMALLLARPDNPKRDIGRARGLLEDLVETYPQSARETGASLVLSLLELEEGYVQLIVDLRTRAASAGAEADDLRGILAQRESELRRIKEILLGRTGGS